MDRCLVRLQDSEGETHREITKDTRLGMCARTHLVLSWVAPATLAYRHMACGRRTLSLFCLLETLGARPS